MDYKIDLCDSSKETFQKIVLQNITSPNRVILDIDSGVVFKESMLSTYNQEQLKDIKYDPNNDEQLSLIYPKKYNNLNEIFVVNLEMDGVYQKIMKSMLLEIGQTYIFGFPAGENQQQIRINEDAIIINENQYHIEEGLCVVLVKKMQKMEQQQSIIKNPTDCTSRKHAHFKVEKGDIYIYDGFENSPSQNGIWLLVKHQKMVLNTRYCFKDFRLQLYLKY